MIFRIFQQIISYNYQHISIEFPSVSHWFHHAPIWKIASPRRGRGDQLTGTGVVHSTCPHQKSWRCQMDLDGFGWILMAFDGFWWNHCTFDCKFKQDLFGNLLLSTANWSHFKFFKSCNSGILSSSTLLGAVPVRWEYLKMPGLKWSWNKLIKPTVLCGCVGGIVGYRSINMILDVSENWKCSFKWSSLNDRENHV